MDDGTRRELEAESLHEHAMDGPLMPEQYERILRRATPVLRTWTGPAFSLPETLPESRDVVRIDSSNASLLRDLFAGWINDLDTCQPMLAIVVDGRAASLCCSVRRSTAAYEAGVETAPPHRGAGLAGRVVSAWASSVRAMGRVPLYSTSWSNEASRAVARKLGMIQFGNDLHVT